MNEREAAELAAERAKNRDLEAKIDALEEGVAKIPGLIEKVNGLLELTGLLMQEQAHSRTCVNDVTVDEYRRASMLMRALIPEKAPMPTSRHLSPVRTAGPAVAVPG